MQEAERSRKQNARDKLVQAAGELMLESGYAAVSSRRVAARAGLKPQLVHYYFKSMDDLYLALYFRYVDGLVERQKAALQSDTPLRSLWNMMRESRGAMLTEFQALANHKEYIHREIASFSRRFRAEQVRILDELIGETKLAGLQLSPAALSLVLNALSRSLATEEFFNIDQGHDEALDFIERLIEEVDAGV